jgi:hypothetical protein
VPIQTKTFRSVFGKNVSLTSERLEHILLRHVEMKRVSTNLTELIREAVEDPDCIILGVYDEHIAIGFDGETKKHLMVPYDEDGEVKTAFISSKVDKLLTRRHMIWKR